MAKRIYIEIIDQAEFIELLIDRISKSLKDHFHSHSSVDNTLLTPKETSEFLKCSRTTLWKLTKEGIIPSIRLGNNIRYEKQEVLKALQCNINYLK